MKKSKPSGHKNVANLPRYQAMLGLRQSSAASPHIPAPQKGTRRAKESKAINDSKEQA